METQWWLILLGKAPGKLGPGKRVGSGREVAVWKGWRPGLGLTGREGGGSKVGRYKILGDGQGHEALASPAEKVSWTCSWITSRATKSCFSLKRPLYSRSPLRSLVANLWRGLVMGARNGAPACMSAPQISEEHRSWYFG